jgi:osmotically-inducible protein OsmY
VHAAHRVPGVLDVVDEIVVVPEPGRERSDADLAAAVRHTLQWDVHVPDARVQSTVSGGWVTLEGEVDVLREREDAERAVGALLGVRGVHNRLAVAVRPVDVAGVRTAIERALARLAHHEANRITVTVEDGIVTLAGTVDSAAERRAVLGVATHLPGIRAVHDRLTLADRGRSALRAGPR